MKTSYLTLVCMAYEPNFIMKDVLNPSSVSGMNMLFFKGLLKIVWESDKVP